MTYVIDTHIFLWLLFFPEKIAAKKLIQLKKPQHKIIITGISFWEIALKYNLGKLALENTTPDKLPQLAEMMGITIESIDAKCMAGFYNLPKIKPHKDPFDCIIIWYCMCNNYTLVSQDSQFGAYKSLGLKVL